MPSDHADRAAPASVPQAEAGGVLTIDLAAIVANWRALAERVKPAECAAVVKADAYGCGLEPVTRALARAGCKTFFVAHLDEAYRVRAIARSAVIYLLNGLPPGTANAFAAHDLRPILNSRPEIEEWRAFVAATAWPGAAALQIDTGMNRLGLPFEDALALCRAPRRERPDLALIMSHFVASEDPGAPLNARQIAAFAEIRAMFPEIAGSLANSSGIFLGPDTHHDLVRPGYALYGGNPTPGHANPMSAVVALKARLAQVHEADEGETVGYGATWTARRATTLAILSAGYGDGIFRAVGASDENPGAEVVIAGRRCPIVGRVSMDLMAVDVTDLPSRPRRGDFATLIGGDITIEELAAHAGTIGYEILTALGRRYARLYHGCI